MPYLILKSNGTTLTTIPDGQFDTVTTSLNLIGKNMFDYGVLQNENFVRLLENFANDTAPINQMRGQIWFDTTSNSLKFYTGTQWKNIATVSVSTSSTAAQELGNFWYDTVNGQLSINTGTTLTVIGPDGVSGFGTTRVVSTKIRDTVNVEHPVLLVYLDGEVVIIVAKTAFQINALDAILGFSVLVRGINLKDAAAKGVTLSGAATAANTADFLLDASSSTYLATSVVAAANTIVQRDANADFAVNNLTVNQITTLTSGTIAGLWNVSNNLIPTGNNGADLGTSERRWGSVFATNLNGSQLTAGSINFSTIVDPFSISISKFDTDGTFTANSDGRIPTQKAIKTYVDSIVGTTPGVAGEQGFTGSRGVGFTGSRGLQGIPGESGGGSQGLRGFTGSAGQRGTDGTSVRILGSVPTSGDLQVPYTGDPGDGYIVTNTGNLWVWSGSAWVDVGNIKGDQGFVGSRGALGYSGSQGSIGFTGSAGITGFTQSAVQNGWTRMPNGVLIQWGRIYTVNAQESLRGPFNFNTNFTAVPWSVVATPLIINASIFPDIWIQVVAGSITVSQFRIQYQRAAGTNPAIGIDGFTWIAIGPGEAGMPGADLPPPGVGGTTGGGGGTLGPPLEPNEN